MPYRLTDRNLSRREFLGFLGCTATAALGTAYVTSISNLAPRAHSSVGLLYSDIYKRHLTGAGHPESPERCDTIIRALSDLRDRLTDLSPRAATLHEILSCHQHSYVETVREDVLSEDSLSTGDTRICPASFEVALQAAGGAMVAVDAVMTGRVHRAFCVVRPPGHHASPTRGGGFCIFNNAGIAARYAQQKYKIGKVAIVDWDAHHGNGTQQIFYSDGSVFYFSTHQHPGYPGTGQANETGSGQGRGCTLNCPLPHGAGRKQIVEESFLGKLMPAVAKFKPDLLIISAGFDSRIGDPLGRFRLEDTDFADLTRIMMSVADRYAGGRLVSVLEGGYSLPGLASATRAHVEALMG